MIRFANENDLDDLIDFERSYMRTFEPHDLNKWEENILKTKDFFNKHFNQMFVIERDASVKGFAYWSIHQELPCVFSIYVDESMRGQGLGKALLLALENQVRENHDILTLSTRLENPARFLFDSMSYSRTKTQDGWIHYKKTLK